MKKNEISKLVGKQFKLKCKLEKVDETPRGLFLAGLVTLLVSTITILATISTTGLIRLISTVVAWSGVGAGIGFSLVSAIIASKSYKNMEKDIINSELKVVEKKLAAYKKAKEKEVDMSKALVDSSNYGSSKVMSDHTLNTIRYYGKKENLIAKKIKFNEETCEYQVEE